MGEQVKRNVLSGLKVKDAMRVQLFKVPAHKPIGFGIRQLVRLKINAFLVSGEDGKPLGVISKTDIIGAYYAELPIESPLEHIMISPPLFCHPEDSLESALDVMRSERIYRLYVRDDLGEVVGALAYPDIVGLLYGYCRGCDKSLMNRKKMAGQTNSDELRITVKDVMTGPVIWFYDSDDLSKIMETMAEHRCGAVLIKNASGVPISVVSKTDLILAYSRGVSVGTQAREILASSKVLSCQENTFLEDAIRKMILSDLQRLFVWSGDKTNITGVVTLSDGARARSGSCHACVSSRIKVE